MLGGVKAVDYRFKCEGKLNGIRMFCLGDETVICGTRGVRGDKSTQDGLSVGFIQDIMEGHNCRHTYSI